MSLKFLSKKDINSIKREASKSISTPEPQTPNDEKVTTLIADNNSSSVKEETSLEGSGVENSSKSNYAGDIIEEASPLEETGYRKLEFESSAELVAYYDKNIKEQVVILHPWQLEESEKLCKQTPNQQKPFKYVLCACNGSGKDAFVVAPFAVWFCLSKIQSRCIITSSSGVQLTAQTEHYITNLCRKVNEHHGQEIFKIRQRYIRCRLSGSEIRLFATDEEGKAEGYHPIEPLAEMAIIINEGKSVAPEIYRALRRCTGYNYWIEVSTPGAPHGDFYTHFSTWEHNRRVSTFECPHLSNDEREVDKKELGEHSALYRSKHLALFTSVDGDCIIPLEVVERVKDLSVKGHIKVAFKDIWPIRVGIDIAAGGDENAIVVTKGNTIIKRLYFRERDTTITAQRIDQYLLHEVKIPKTHPYINADDGGIGRGVIDQLNSNYGWNIARVNNQSPSSNKQQYLNRGAENWYRIKRILEESFWFFSQDDVADEKLLQQLSTRYYKQAFTSGKIALETKKEAKANGRPSPDRADAFILSLTGLTVTDFLAIEKTKEAMESSGKRILSNADEITTWHDNDVTYAEYEGRQVGKHKKSGGGRFSINTLVNRAKTWQSSI